MKYLLNMPQRHANNRFELTDLNIRTSILYAACEANGGHKRSGIVIQREMNAMPWAYNICSACGVPIRMRASAAGWAA